ncbi:MAG TPA: hypothetical protein VF627_01305 [Abditibacterium sp.]|jgi:hypothetical protein
MKRFSLREFGFLCAPVVLIAAVGWFVSHRQNPADQGPLRLQFYVENPTIMEAFRGTDAVMVVSLQGWNTQGAPNPNSLRIHRGIAQLEVQTSQGAQVSHFDGSSGRWKQWRPAWESGNNRRIGVNFGRLPQGKLLFGMTASVRPASLTSRAPLRHLFAQWTLSPQQIKPFSFQRVAAPAVVVRSARITNATPGSQWIYGEVVFDLVGPRTNAQTSFGFAQTTTSVNDSSWGTSTTWNATPETPTRRVREFRLRKIVKRFLPPNQGQIVRLSGRANADNCWPTAFQIQAFDFAKVKTGQNLPVKSWNSPIPKP